MSSTASDDYRLTQSGLETGLRVGHIATFPLEACEFTDDTADVRSDKRFIGFDQIPVRKEGRVVGVYEPGYGRQAQQSGRSPVSALTRPLDDSLLVSADLPLAKFMEIVRSDPYRLVVQGASITGIVTWSDLQKLPVRLFVFSVVIHLEMLMLEVIKPHYQGNDTWEQLISSERRKQVRRDFERLRSQDLDPDKLEVTSFNDKRLVLGQVLSLDQSQLAELHEIKQHLRDTIAHSQAYADSPDAVRDFSRRLGTTQNWVDKLTAIIDQTKQ